MVGAMSGEIRLPKKIVECITELKKFLDPAVYARVCSLIVDLDGVDLLNDQIVISADIENNNDANMEWPNYGLFVDVERVPGCPSLAWPEGIMYRIHFPRTKTLVKLGRYDAAKTAVIGLLEPILDKGDIYDDYRKDKRTEANTEVYLPNSM